MWRKYLSMYIQYSNGIEVVNQTIPCVDSFTHSDFWEDDERHESWRLPSLPSDEQMSWLNQLVGSLLPVIPAENGEIKLGKFLRGKTEKESCRDRWVHAEEKENVNDWLGRRWKSMHSGWLHFNENLDRNRGGRKGQTLKLGKRTVCRCREMAF